VDDYIVVVMQHWLACDIHGWPLNACTALLEGPSHGWEVAF